jgi:hypothetical protein
LTDVQKREEMSAGVEASTEDGQAQLEHLAFLREQLAQSHRLRREMVEQLTRENQELRQSADRAQLKAWRSAYDAALAEWRLRSLRQRRWWLLGSLLGQVRRSPRHLLRLPLDVMKILRGSPDSLPRPDRPPRPARLSGSAAEPHGSAELRLSDASPIPRRLMVVGCLVDDKRVRLLEHEWQCVRLTSTDWAESFREARPELVFISLRALAHESWNSTQAIGHGTEASELDALVEQAGRQGARTCIWVDDPSEFRSGRWHRLIARCDIALGIDEDVTRDLQGITGPSLTMTFGPSFQSRLANPRSHEGRGRLIGLSPAGEPHDEGLLRVAEALRAEPLDLLSEPCDLAAARASGFAVTVDASQSSSVEMLDRVLASAAAGTPTLTTESCRLPGYVAEATLTSSGERGQRLALKALRDSETIRARLGHKALRVAMREGSTRVHVDGLLQAAGIDSTASLPGLSLMIPTNRPDNITSALANVARQSYDRLEVVLVLHGIDVDHSRLDEHADQLGISEFSVVRVPREQPLGEVLNIGFSACKYPFVGKIDDDDFYGEDYAHDLMSCFEFADTEVVGKWTHYAYDSASNAMYLRYPGADYTFQKLVAISTMMFKKEIMEQVRFPPYPSGSGSAFLHELRTYGGRVFSGDRYNYMYVRNPSNGQHTWSFDAYEIAAHSRAVCRGKSLDEVIV